MKIYQKNLFKNNLSINAFHQLIENNESKFPKTPFTF